MKRILSYAAFGVGGYLLYLSSRSIVDDLQGANRSKEVEFYLAGTQLRFPIGLGLIGLGWWLQR